jgi:S1-C subfamily serine protease
MDGRSRKVTKQAEQRFCCRNVKRPSLWAGLVLGGIVMSSCSSRQRQAGSFSTAPCAWCLAQVLLGRWLVLFALCAAGAPSPTLADAEPTLWHHNGSVLYLVARGTLREFHYKEPRSGLLEEGVRPGTLLFRGESKNHQYVGTAYIFNSRCGALPYQVSGPILDHDERVLLTGRAPEVGPDCWIISYFDDVLEFRLIKQQQVDSGPEVRRPELAPPSSPQSSATRKSIGSGVVIGAEGEILTNAHVVDSCSKITIGSSSASAATLVARDEKNDLAIVRGNPHLSSVIAFREGKPVRAGDVVVALGYPLSGLLATTPNVSVGNVSALAGLSDDSRYLQISAPVQPGNSGGPLLDASGHLIGIVTGKLDAARIFHFFGDIPQNVNFALKAEVARTFLDSKGITYQTARSEGQLSPADVGEMARPLTVQIECDQRTDAGQSRPTPTPQPPKEVEQPRLAPPVHADQSSSSLILFCISDSGGGDGIIVRATEARAGSSLHVVHKVDGQLYDRNVQYQIFAFRQDQNRRSYYWDGVLAKDSNVLMTGHLWLNAGAWYYNEYVSFKDGSQPVKLATPPVMCQPTG